jgi:hypothetical protein
MNGTWCSSVRSDRGLTRACSTASFRTWRE